MSYDSVRNRMVLFGGLVGGIRQNDTWEWDGTAWQFRGNGGPSARFYHAMAYDPVRQRTVLFGGLDVSFRRDTWEWDGTSWTQKSNSGPTPRMGSALAFDPIQQKVLLSGGFTGLPSNETWTWNGTTWTQNIGSGPSARYNHALVGDPQRGKVVLFGGILGAGLFSGETWEWNGATWSLACGNGPPARYAQGMANDPIHGQTLMYGGYNTVFLSDMWLWSGAGWKQLIAPTPGARRAFGMAYESAAARYFVFGGEDAVGYRGDTWNYLPPAAPVVVQQPLPAPAMIGGPASFSVNASGIGPLNFLWRRNGVPLADGGVISGAGTPTLNISALSASDLAAYDCVVWDACGSTRSDPAAPSVSGAGCPGDTDGNNMIDGADIQPFVTALLTGSPCAPPPVTQTAPQAAMRSGETLHD
ncbi:MAG: hypothetical protein U1A27_10460 [Phycisphaerae bacterium]